MPAFVGDTMPRAAVHPFRRFPLDSSDTDYEAPYVLPVSSSVDPAAGVAGHYLGAPERTRYQPRGTSTLGYQNPGSRDLRNRSYSRSSRNVVVVTPPPDLPLDQDRLGNVLSVGPRHRLTQGILMPLFPSMPGQLSAIAREYNFPSTLGLCLYLHINENGIKMSPRISDDSWQYLFGHLFDGRPSSGGKQPQIGGSIEFDIDLDKARWFDSWISGTLRDSDPVFPPVAISRTSLEARWRGEGQTVNADGQPVEGRWNASGSHTLVTNSRPETLRHLPKKLSLVDRLDSHGVHAPPGPEDYPEHPESSSTHGTYASSPILQSAIPQVTESDLERRVNSWRVDTELYPPSMAETYQPSPDVGVPAGLTIMDEYALARNFRQAVRIDEFLWSITSAGPRSPVTESLIASSRPSSIHLDRRANGTVPPTPTTMTSWGPTDDGWHSVVSGISRLPSPDMGERVVEDVMAPRSRAVWGNSFGWRTAMTWKQVYPCLLTQKKPTIRVQLRDSNGLVPQYPNLVIYPPVASQSDTRFPLNMSKLLESPPQSVWGSSFGWQKTVTWRKVYPYSTATMQSLASIQLCGTGGLEPKYPDLYIYPAVYPYFDIYPTCNLKEDISQPVSAMLNASSEFLTSYPSLVLYPAVYPHFAIYPPVVESAKMKGSSQVDTAIYLVGGASTSYPNLVIYPAVYPHFDIYPKALQINEALKQNEVGVGLVNVGHLRAEYPNMTIYPGIYPYLGTYPTRDTDQKQASGAAWGISFGWLTAKTWLRVYPLHTAGPLTTRRYVDIADQSGPISQSGSDDAETATTVVMKQAVWGSSFGWKSATAWRVVWPTPFAQTHPNVGPVSVHLVQQGDAPPNYPYFVIYPPAYPHIDIYPSRAAILTVEESQPAKEDQFTVELIPHYPNIVIYPAAYPHFDLYPAFVVASGPVKHEKGESNLRRRRMEMWIRAKTAAQVGLIELIANNHIWEVQEPLQLNMADYAWSRTSAGPSTYPLELLDTPPIPGSVHIDRRLQGSVLRTASTATTWGPQDGDWYSEIESIERLPSPDLGWRVFDDTESIEFSHQPWHMIWPFFRDVSEVKTPPPVLEQSFLVSEYPRLVIYPPAYPHFELYPTWANAHTFENEVTETLTNLRVYPAFDIYPAVYPYFNIYPVSDLQIENPSEFVSNVRDERVQVRLASLYPNFDIYRACYPYNLDYIYPFVNATESTQMLIEAPRGYPWLVVYPPVYPFVIPYAGFSAEISQPFEPEQSPISSPKEWKLVNVKLPVHYPLLDLYPAGYPWSLESIYPAVSDPPVYPFVQPYPDVSGSVHVPRALDEGEYESAKASLALPELVPTSPGSAVYPRFDLYPAAPVLVPQQRVQEAYAGYLTTAPPLAHITKRRQRMTHMELHASVFRSLGKQRARSSKTHLQLHAEVFQDGVVWTPSGYIQDLLSLVTKRPAEIPAPEPRRPRPSPDNSTPRPSRSRSVTTAAQSPGRTVFPLVQPPALPPISPLRVRSPGIPSQPPPAVSETPIPRLPSPTSTYAHMRTTSTRLSQAVKSMMPGGQRRNSNAASASPTSEDHKGRAKSPARFLTLVDRRPTAVPPLPHANTSEFLTRAPRNTQHKESFVLQRTRAYEQVTAANQSSDPVGTNGAHSPFVIPLLPSMSSMTGVAEEIEKSSKVTFP